MLLKSLPVAFLIASSICFSSCFFLAKTFYGLKKPRPTADAVALDYLAKNKIGYDFVIRPKSDSVLFALEKRMSIGMNSIVLYNNNGDELGNTNDSTCHYSLRTEITQLIRKNEDAIRFSKKNVRDFLDTGATCLACAAKGKPLFLQPLKKYVLMFTYATFIPCKHPFSDVDYIQELSDARLRDRVSVVMIDADIH